MEPEDKRVPRVMQMVHIDSTFTKRCPGADGPGFNPTCLFWIRPTDMRCLTCQQRLDRQMDGQVNDNRPHIRMFTSSRRMCTLKQNCKGLMEAYLKSTWPGGQAVANRELWWKCIRCGATKQAGSTFAKTEADALRCDGGEDRRITCPCPKCCLFFQDPANATNAVTVFMSEAQEQARHIKSILKDQELK